MAANHLLQRRTSKKIHPTMPLQQSSPFHYHSRSKNKYDSHYIIQMFPRTVRIVQFQYDDVLKGNASRDEDGEAVLDLQRGSRDVVPRRRRGLLRVFGIGLVFGLPLSRPKGR